MRSELLRDCRGSCTIQRLRGQLIAASRRWCRNLPMCDKSQHTMRLPTVCLSLLFISGGSAQQGDLVTPDAVFYNGKSVTVDSGFSIQQAFGLKGEKFLAVGTTATVRAMAGPNTRQVDLHGATVIPGLSDAHHHV